MMDWMGRTPRLGSSTPRCEPTLPHVLVKYELATTETVDGPDPKRPSGAMAAAGMEPDALGASGLGVGQRLNLT